MTTIVNDLFGLVFQCTSVCKLVIGRVCRMYIWEQLIFVVRLTSVTSSVWTGNTRWSRCHHRCISDFMQFTGQVSLKKGRFLWKRTGCMRWSMYDDSLQNKKWILRRPSSLTLLYSLQYEPCIGQSLMMLLFMTVYGWDGRTMNKSGIVLVTGCHKGTVLLWWARHVFQSHRLCLCLPVPLVVNELPILFSLHSPAILLSCL